MKKFFRSKILLIGLVILSISLSGCGGGGSSPKPNYQAFGVGVIMPPRDDSDEKDIMKSKSVSGKSLNFQSLWKQMDISSKGFTAFQTKSDSAFQAVAVGVPFVEDFVTKYMSFILLSWDRVNGAHSYKVFYEENPIWDSEHVSTADPVFIENEPRAYLDLSEELDKKITDKGKYKFQIVAYNANDNIITQLPEVTASIGMELAKLPENVTYNSTTISWDSVSGADQYRLIFKREGSASIEVNGLLTTSYDVSSEGSLTSGYYEVWVEAWHLGTNGKPVEVTRQIVGITYP